jgi:hypothetical protein
VTSSAASKPTWIYTQPTEDDKIKALGHLIVDE